MVSSAKSAFFKCNSRIHMYIHTYISCVGGEICMSRFEDLESFKSTTEAKEQLPGGCGIEAWLLDTPLKCDEFCFNESEACKFSKFLYFPSFQGSQFTSSIGFRSSLHLCHCFSLPFRPKIRFPSFGQARGMPCWCQSVRRILDKPGNFAISFRKERPSA